MGMQRSISCHVALTLTQAYIILQHDAQMSFWSHGMVTTDTNRSCRPQPDKLCSTAAWDWNLSEDNIMPM